MSNLLESCQIQSCCSCHQQAHMHEFIEYELRDLFPLYCSCCEVNFFTLFKILCPFSFVLSCSIDHFTIFWSFSFVFRERVFLIPNSVVLFMSSSKLTWMNYSNMRIGNDSIEICFHSIIALVLSSASALLLATLISPGSSWLQANHRGGISCITNDICLVIWTMLIAGSVLSALLNCPPLGIPSAACNTPIFCKPCTLKYRAIRIAVSCTLAAHWQPHRGHLFQSLLQLFT